MTDSRVFVNEIVSRRPLGNHLKRLEEARRAVDYNELRGLDRIAKRDGETEQDFRLRPLRSVGLARSAVSALTAHLYNPGPNRTHEIPEADQFLNAVYGSNQVNALCQKIDEWATLHGAAAIGVTSTPLNTERPIRLDVFGGHELVVWTPSDDPGEAEAVCVVACDKATSVETYTLWTASKTWTFVRDVKDREPTQSRVADNPYGRIPFVFFHNGGVVVSEFWEGGLGNYLADANAEIDRHLSDSAQGEQNSIPIGWIKNASLAQKIRTGFGIFNRLTGNNAGTTPEIGYAQSGFDADAAAASAEAFAYLALEMVGVPRSAIRLDLSQGMSGIAVIMEQLPLLTRAKKRQTQADRFEIALAKLILQIHGTVFADTQLVSAAAIPIRTTWPELQLPVPMPERDSAQQFELEQGFTSKVMVVMSRYNMTRTQALEHLAQVKADQEALEPPAPAPSPQITPPTSDQEGEAPPQFSTESLTEADVSEEEQEAGGLDDPANP